MNSSLESLHIFFETTLKTSKYIGKSERETNTFTRTENKQIRLHKVFELAREQISTAMSQKNLYEQEISTLKNRIKVLNLLRRDGDAYYEKYEAVTHSFSRQLLKELARLTPDFLKIFLPACFSNEMEEAERLTKQQYDSYVQTIIKSTEDLQREIEKQEAIWCQPKNEIEIPDKGIKTPPQEDKPGQNSAPDFQINIKIPQQDKAGQITHVDDGIEVADVSEDGINLTDEDEDEDEDKEKDIQTNEADSTYIDLTRALFETDLARGALFEEDDSFLNAFWQEEVDYSADVDYSANDFLQKEDLEPVLKLSK